METNRTEIASLGEFGLIDRFKTNTSTSLAETVRGIGDDAAVIDGEADQYSLLSTELFIEGVHFDLTFFPLKHLGYKVISAAVSDIAAMNGLPSHITIGIALSNRFSVEAVDEIYEGFKFACRDYKIDLVGGDTTSSRAGLIISVSVYGKVNKSDISYRHTAKPNDIICLTGDLGAAYMGLQLLEREKQVFLVNPDMQPDLEGKDYVIQRQLRPEARLDVIHELKEAGVIPTAMIDVSDGLASDLLHLCKQSGTGAVIFEENMPIDEQTYLTGTELNLSPLTAALNGGEEYELLFTIKQPDYDKIKNNPKIVTIGYMTNNPSEVVLHTKAESRIPLTAQGWNF
jgi:thiamine-monophosphate kinase